MTSASAICLELALVLCAGCRGERRTGTEPAGTPNVLVASFASAPEDGAPAMSDVRLEGALAEAMAADPRLRSTGIRVRATEGAVTWTGSVPTLADQRRAHDLAASFKGVQSITNDLAITPTKEPDNRLADEVVRAVRRDPAARSATVRATAAKGVVTLTGFARSPALRELVRDAAARVRGVQRLDIHVAVPGGPPRTDPEAQADAAELLGADARLDGTRVEARVHGGRAQLSGVVGSLAQQEAAVGDVKRAGIDEVDEGTLRVDGRALEKTALPERSVPSDEEIGRAVRRSLSDDARMGSEQPGVQVRRGVVTLNGTVVDFRAQKGARHDAQTVSGVRGVDDQTRVRPAIRQTDAAIERQVLESMYTGEAAQDARGVQVTTLDARVTLAGTVATEKDRNAIEADAEEVPGVTAVRNELAVRESGAPGKSTNAQTVSHAATENLFWDPRMEDEPVNVEVAPNGDVVLEGTVRSWEQAEAANDDAVRAGATHVINRIRIEPGGGP